ncbi:Planctomycete cytochrome C [Singulisphaera sp. GP187]|uniref:PSD1 and planctomycete cytochrome C domain-containing protein n=1 Tax=Singulisphaera sp. GP187 TaxID=1882752 RepID=UPI00092A765B|nr:PSD1 and planctomycete cytochrome C domain-containing protein [Singulisphaera sp. GP187]SIO67908.1 Planctomycete cytochrome C [Singulisphaera sp. GP187]
MRRSLRLAGFLTLSTLAMSAHAIEPADRKVDFARDIEPLLAEHCAQCHGPTRQRSGYRVDHRDAALRGGDSGEPAIIPGQATKSRLVQLITGLDPDAVMPPKGRRLDASQVDLIRVWIDQGADWSSKTNDPVQAEQEAHWSLKPLIGLEVPRPGQRGWGRTPIDDFILTRLEEEGLAPSPEADRRTLIRRLTFDLTGLPPTPEEVATFIADPGAHAYERLVDRLLESPRYGERWARRWMDVVHFAETHGNDQDRPRPNAWPYRDYLIRSFNDDTPYARFVQEQLAGDVLFPGDPQAIVALGFIAAGPWDESSQRDIRDDTVDKKVAQNLDRDDMVATTMATFTSTTVHCARCHDHKFDPISQAEYYGLQAVFAGVDRAERPYDLDPKAESLRAPLVARRTALQSRRPAMVDSRLDPATRAALVSGQAAWESAAAESLGWTTLDPLTFTSAGGATADKLADGSIRFRGPRPEVDTYTIVARSDLHGISAVRLEVLADDGLPHKGPGRQDNGNLHLTEFRLKAARASDPSRARPIRLLNPGADFDQKGWDIAKAIDDNPATAWGIYPAVGQSHQAAFETSEPLGTDGETELTFTLEQSHGGGHLIGRVRLSATTTSRPAMAQPLPDPITKLLAVPAPARTEAQRAELTAYYYTIAPALTRVIEDVDRQLAAIPPASTVYAAAHDFKPESSFVPAKTPRPVQILKRGDINSPVRLAVPGALACVPGLDARFTPADPNDEGSRRAALARWITDPKNVLTWRSIVNRVWHYHFGRGLADSPNDLGRMGAKPSHPELIDWLAVRFRNGGGSLKQLDRLIVTSSVYRQACRHDSTAAARDGDNALLWRMNRTRLDAESVRDAVLQISGKLDLMMGGPSVRQFVETPGIHVTPMVNYLQFDVDSAASYRRSVYRFLFRTLPDPFMDSMDCPDASQLSPTRNASVTALQALAMLNDRFIVRQSEHFAARVGKLATTPAGQIEAVYRLALGRSPSPDESEAFVAYAVKHGMANVCRLILNSNEFMFVD